MSRSKLCVWKWRGKHFELSRVISLVDFSGSTGCQPVVAGSLAGNMQTMVCWTICVASRQAAEMNRLAACAPQKDVVPYPLHVRKFGGSFPVK